MGVLKGASGENGGREHIHEKMENKLVKEGLFSGMRGRGILLMKKKTLLVGERIEAGYI